MHRIHNRALAWALTTGALGLGVVAGTLGQPLADRTVSLVDAAQRVRLPDASTPPEVPAGAGRSALAPAARDSPAVTDPIVLLRPPSTRSVTTTPPVVTAPDALAKAEAAVARACVRSVPTVGSASSAEAPIDRPGCPDSRRRGGEGAP